MLRQFLRSLVAAIARMLIADVCGEAFRLLFEHVAPDAPQLIYMAGRLLLRTMLVTLMVRIKTTIARGGRHRT
jgi:hypothetical protein